MKLNPIGSNQTEITIPNGTVFFSYSTPVAACIHGQYYRTEEKHSVTTSRHIKAWLGDNFNRAEVKPQSFFEILA